MPDNPALPARVHDGYQSFVHLACAVLDGVVVAGQFEEGLAIGTAGSHEFLRCLHDAADHAGAEMSQLGGRIGGHVGGLEVSGR